MMGMRRNKIFATFLVFSAALTFLSEANATRGARGEEIKYLPRYCQVRINGEPAAEVNLWRRKFGRSHWGALHHYCQYVISEYRYYKSNDREAREDLLIDTVYGIQKQLKEFGPKFILRHDAYYRLGWAYAKLGRTAEAAQAYQKAIQIKPKYVKAYRALTDLYKDLGLLDEALETANLGIKKVPRSKALKRRKSEIQKLMKKK